MSDSERVQYKFMIPKLLKAQLEQAAAKSYRSLSSEVVLRLHDSVSKRPQISDDPLVNEREMLREEMLSAKFESEAAHHRMMDIQRRLDDVEATISARPAS